MKIHQTDEQRELASPMKLEAEKILRHVSLYGSEIKIIIIIIFIGVGMRNNRKVSLVELLILGLLCYLGHGLTFDDCEESTAIDQEVHRVFFVFSLCMAVLFFTKDGC
jgi:hypothetical protein